MSDYKNYCAEEFATGILSLARRMKEPIADCDDITAFAIDEILAETSAFIERRRSEIHARLKPYFFAGSLLDHYSVTDGIGSPAVSGSVHTERGHVASTAVGMAPGAS